MEEAIINTTKLLKEGSLTLDEANKILLDLYHVNKKSDQVKQKFTIGQNVKILSGVEILHTSITKIEWDELNCDWKYYFKDNEGLEWFGYENEMETK